MAYTMSSGASWSSGVGSADRIDMEVSDRTNTSRKYASAVKHARVSPPDPVSVHSACGNIAVQSPSTAPRS